MILISRLLSICMLRQSHRWFLDDVHFSPGKPLETVLSGSTVQISDI